MTIDAFSGRSVDAKKGLYEGIVDRFESLGVGPRDVLIVINEIPLENSGIRGGQAAIDIDLGFSWTSNPDTDPLMAKTSSCGAGTPPISLHRR